MSGLNEAPVGTLRAKAMLLLSLAAAAAACTETALPQPVLEEVCALEGDDCPSGVFAGEEAILVIRGSGLFQGFSCDLGNGDPLPLAGAFAAWVGERPVERLVPEVYAGDGTEALRGYLAPGLRVGLHSLRVRAPSGQAASLSDAFMVANPLSLDGAVSDPYPPEGGALVLSISIRNLGRASLRELRLSLSESGEGDLDLPGVQALEPLSALGTRTLSFEIPARRQGRVDLALFVQAEVAGAVPLEAEAQWHIQVTAP